MTMLITFFAALRAGDLWARAMAVGLVLAGFVVLAGVMLYRHDAAVTARALQSVRKANEISETKADAAENAVKNCPRGYDRNKGDCND